MNQAGGGGWASPVRDLHLSQCWPLSPDKGNEHWNDVTFIRSKKRANPVGIMGEQCVWGGSLLGKKSVSGV